jgi:hypothetical protein
MKFPVRLTALGACVALAASVGGAGAASAQTSGVGTAAVTTNLLDINLAGGLLGLKVISDQGKSNVDPATGTSQAISQLIPISLSSNTLSLINTLNGALGAVNQKFVAQSPGGNPNVSTPGVNFATPATGLALPLNLLSGSLNAGTLSALFDSAKGATSALDTSLTNLNVAGGLLTADTFGDQNGSAANTGLTTGSRTVNIGDIKALNLGALLQGLGINPGSLPTNIVTGLVDKLGLPLTGLPTGATNLGGATTLLNSLIANLSGVITTGGAAGSTPGSLLGTIGGLLGQPGLGSTIPLASLTGGTNTLASTITSVQAVLGSAAPAGLAMPTGANVPVATVQTLLTNLSGALGTVNGLLANLLGQGLSGILNTSLLELKGAQLGVVTKAAPSLSDSAANIVAQLGAIKVAGLDIPALNLTATLQQVTDLLNSANSALSGLLGTLSPNLANLVHVSVLDKLTSVGASGGYNKAAAGLTALTASIDPSKILGGLTGLVTSLTGASVASAGTVHSADLGTTGILGALTSLGTPAGGLPVISSLVPDLGKLLGVGNLLSPNGLLSATTIKVGEVLSGAQYIASSTPAAVPNAPAVVKSLPRTGAHTTQWAALAAMLFALALGVRRWIVRRPVLD